MARTPSTMLELGIELPEFSLQGTAGERVSMHNMDKTQGLVVMFISNHCPFVIHLKEALADFGRHYHGRMNIIAIASNDTEAYPQDGLDAMRSDKAEYGYCFPYLLDEDQETAKAFKAACTPDFYLFDAEQTLVYRGQFDGSRPGNEVAPTGVDLRTACDRLLNHQPQVTEQKPSLGCNIKWKPGNAPDYFGR
jgi:peroxiredoxin